jgi:hypothetical protein
MQLNTLIDDLKEFKKTDWLEKGFRELFSKINEFETCTPNDKFDQFTYNAPIVINEEVVENEVLVTFESFKLQKFKAKIKTIHNEFEILSEIEKNYYCESLIAALNLVSNSFSKDSGLKNYQTELKLAVQELSNKYSKYLNRTTKNNSFNYITGRKNNDFTKIRVLYKALKEGELIDKETTLNDFELVFKNETIKKLIRWTGSTSELKYFIKIINTPDYGFEDNADEKWRVAVNCFIKVKKRSIEKVDFKNLRTYKITPATITKLDSLIVKSFRK